MHDDEVDSENKLLQLWQFISTQAKLPHLKPESEVEKEGTLEIRLHPTITHSISRLDVYLMIVI